MKRSFTALLSILSISAFGQFGWVGNLSPSGTSNTATTGVGYNIYIDVYKMGITEAGGQGGGIDCHLHYGSVDAFGGAWSDITDEAMSYHGDSGNNDVYTYNLDAAPGLYEYTCYCDDGTGQVWHDGANAGTTFTAILPVNYANIQLQNEISSYSLSWKTASEVNNAFFEVYISRDGQSWSLYDQIKSKTEDSNAYFLEIRKDWPEMYVYLSQTDFNGNKSRSDILHSYQADRYSDNFQVFPNPFSHMLNIDDCQACSWRLLDSNMQTKAMGNTSTSTTVKVDYLNPGIYVLEVINNNEKSCVKLLKY